MSDQSNNLPSGRANGPRAERIEAPVHPILARMRFMSRLLDNSIQLPGGYRIGLDPLIGLIPAAGDFLAAGLSLWLVWDALRLGISKRVVIRMLGNILVETVLGAVPVLGDLFDATWKANARNLTLVELNYSRGLKQRNSRSILLFFAACAIAVFATVALMVYAVVRAVLSFF